MKKSMIAVQIEMGKLSRNLLASLFLMAVGVSIPQSSLAQVTCHSVHTAQLRTFPFSAVGTEPSMTREEFYKAYATTLLAPTSSISLSSYARRKYKNGDDVYARLMQIDYSMRVLIVDPGIVQRFADFVKFAKSHNELKSEPWKMREAFSRSLGSEIVYRGISVPKSYQITANLLAKGFVTDGLNALLSHQYLNQTFENQVANHLIDNKMKPIDQREHGDLPDFVMSVSSHYLVSKSVAALGAILSKPAHLSNPIEQDLVVFKMLIPKLDLSVYHDYPDDPQIFNFGSEGILQVVDLGKEPNGAPRPSRDFTEGVEKFIFGFISSQEILEVERTDYNLNNHFFHFYKKPG